MNGIAGSAAVCFRARTFEYFLGLFDGLHFLVFPYVLVVTLLPVLVAPYKQAAIFSR